MANVNTLGGPKTGSIIIDGTSYSGADIKVLIHIYGQNALSSKKAELVNKLVDLQVNNDLLIRKLRSFQSNTALSNVRREQEIRDINDEINGNNTNIRAIKSEIDLLESNKVSFVTKELAEMQTLSVSTYREKYPVRAISTVYPKGFTRGPRTIAGSMVFTVFNKNVLYELLDADASEFDADHIFSTAVIDQLPPFDITIVFANEMGQLSRMTIYGVEFVSEGQTMSIHDLFIENTCQYIARDIDPMTAQGDLRSKVLTPGTKLASDLANDSSAQEYKVSNDPFERFKNRANPFAETPRKKR